MHQKTDQMLVAIADREDYVVWTTPDMLKHIIDPTEETKKATLMRIEFRKVLREMGVL